MMTAMLVARRLLVSVLLIWCGCGMSMAQPALEPLPVWYFQKSAPPSDKPPLPHQRWVLQENRIRFNAEALRSLRDLTRPSLPRLVMDLSQSMRREVVVRSRNSSSGQAILVEGRLPGDPLGEFMLSLRGEAVSGRLQIGPRVWAIEPGEGGSHRLMEIDPELMPRD